MDGLKISEDLSLPLEAVTQTFAILAKRGSGKTYTAMVFVEELLGAGLQTVVVDPVGVAWGLRSSADGEGPGLPITVLGGEHGDLAIGPASGEAIADVVIDTGQSFVLDLALFRKGEQNRFFTDFAERLYHRNRSPLQLVLDEADAFAPQRPIKGQERMLGAVEDLVRRGRARGLGVTLITQRPAVLHKDVLTQVEVLVALRLIAPQDREAIDAWIRVHGTPEQRAELMASLPSLPIGTAWVWSPGWLDLFRRVEVRRRRTFDSSATPKVGQIVTAPKVLAPVDLDAIRAKLEAAPAPVEVKGASRDQARALAEQRRLLEENGGRIAALEAELRDLRARPDYADLTVLLERAEQAIVAGESAAMRMIDAVGELRAELARHRSAPPEASPAPIDQKPSRWSEIKERVQARGGRPRELVMRPVAVVPSDLSNPQIRILEALASFRALGVESVARSNVAVFADQSPRSSGFANNFGALRSKGLVSYPAGQQVAITEDGLLCVDELRPIRSLVELHEAWYAKLPRPQVAILRLLLSDGRLTPWHRELLADRAGQSPTSSGYANNLGALRSLGLIDYPSRGKVMATSLLFPDGLR